MELATKAVDLFDQHHGPHVEQWLFLRRLQSSNQVYHFLGHDIIEDICESLVGPNLIGEKGQQVNRFFKLHRLFWFWLYS